MNTRMREKGNLFIAFEGIDGCGKSTQIHLLAERLEAAGHKVDLTCEPTHNFIGQKIREAFTNQIYLDNRVIAGLFVADRLQHILDESEGIQRKLADGYTVLTDRYYLSSYAYQGAYVDQDWVIQANALAASLCPPDLHIYIDLPPEISMERITSRNHAIQLYESLNTLQKVHTSYQKAIQKVSGSESIFTVDGVDTIEHIRELIWQEILPLART